MTEQELFSEALIYATKKHKDQKRRDNTPYIYHPIAVANLVKNAGFGLRYQIVALLHDTLEDTDATEEEILFFGEDILKSVKLLTRPNDITEDEYLKSIFTDHMATVVKNADKIHNLWELSFIDKPGKKRSESAKKFAKRYIEKSEKYYKEKFSLAVDNSLEKAKIFSNTEIVEEKKNPEYTQLEMKLYTDKK